MCYPSIPVARHELRGDPSCCHHLIQCHTTWLSRTFMPSNMYLRIFWLEQGQRSFLFTTCWISRCLKFLPHERASGSNVLSNELGTVLSLRAGSKVPDGASKSLILAIDI